MQRILLVCLGNICRSPMAEGAVRRALDAAGLNHVETDSAGTSGWHIGAPPDPRAVRTSLMRDIDIAHQRARQVRARDFHDFDLILAMDNDNLTRLRDMQPVGAPARIRLLMEFADKAEVSSIPDPYYGGEDGFSHALDLIEDAARGLATYIAARSPNPSG